MSNIAIALIPSNQERNSSPHNTAYNEYGGMKYFTKMLFYDLERYPGIAAEYFEPRSELLDSYPLEALYEVQKLAVEWLNNRPEKIKLIINFHTDSGENSHTYGIYGGNHAIEGRVAAAIAGCCSKLLDTDRLEVFTSKGGVDYSTYVFASTPYPAVLIEICSHGCKKDIDKLWMMSGLLAMELAARLSLMNIGSYRLLGDLREARDSVEEALSCLKSTLEECGAV